jgi:membrane-associated phospholipid phosphatase
VSNPGPAGTPHHSPAPLPVLRRRILLAGVILLGLGVLVAVLVAGTATHPAVQRLDDEWYRLTAAHRWAPLVSFSKVLSAVFGTAIDWPLRALVTVVIVIRRRWLALAAWVVTVFASELSIGPLKSLIDRPRPPGSLIATSGASFPSGHAIASAVTAIGIVMALATGRRRLWGMVVAAVVAALVALSRTYLAAHWLTDVLAGALVGAGLALAIPEAFEVARDRRALATLRSARPPRRPRPPRRA